MTRTHITVLATILTLGLTSTALAGPLILERTETRTCVDFHLSAIHDGATGTIQVIMGVQRRCGPEVEATDPIRVTLEGQVVANLPDRPWLAFSVQPFPGAVGPSEVCVQGQFKTLDGSRGGFAPRPGAAMDLERARPLLAGTVEQGEVRRCTTVVEQ
ncbi:MAG: hypothetical protein AAF533_11890 [Acidobacteriota bacterium]